MILTEAWLPGFITDEHDLTQDCRYCEKDVLAVAQVLLRFMNLPKIEADRIESVTQF